jgi:hypothetical protein
MSNVKDTPEYKMAMRFFTWQGRPDHLKKRGIAWIPRFAALLKLHKNLDDVLTWAFEQDEQWPNYLIRHDGQDPFDYMESRLNDIFRSYDAWQSRQPKPRHVPRKKGHGCDSCANFGWDEDGNPCKFCSDAPAG